MEYCKICDCYPCMCGNNLYLSDREYEQYKDRKRKLGGGLGDTEDDDIMIATGEEPDPLPSQRRQNGN